MCCPVFAAGIHIPVGLNTDQMEEGEQYSEYSVERNPRAYMSMRDYKSLPWHNQQPLRGGWNPNTYRSMKDYRNQWMGAPLCNVSPTNAPFDNTYNPSWGNHTNSSWEPRPSQYAPPPHPQHASLSQPQPPQPISPVEQAILDLTKLVGDVVEEQKKFNAQLNQRIHTMENSLDLKLDGLQSGIDHKIDNLQTSISRLAQQNVHQEEENMEEECILGEQAQMQPQRELMQEPLQAPEDQPTREAGGGRGKGAGEEHQRLTLHLNPINLDPSATAQPQNSPLSVYILPIPTVNSKPATSAPKAESIPSELPVQYFRKLVATVQAFATTSKTLAATHVA